MNKEQTPLEALHSFDHWIQVEFAEQFKIIETALKRIEIIDKLNEKHYEETQNKLTAFEIINEIFNFEVVKDGNDYLLRACCSASFINEINYEKLKRVLK